jgi:hypothetical protein
MTLSYNSYRISDKIRLELNHVGYDVLTAVVMNVGIFWDIAPCSPYVNGYFRGRYDHLLMYLMLYEF